MIAMLQKCQTEECKDIAFKPDSWNLPMQAQRAVEWERRKAEEERERREALADPEKYSRLRAERIAAWNAWKSCVR